MSIKIALAGNPNCGKTTMFNALTGSSQYVGNWPGVTVEKKEGKLKGHKEVTIVDLPGIYSLSPYTLEEVVTRNFIIDEHPDVIINLVDASNIERNLYLTTQLVEIGIPVIIALNMIDVVKKNGDVIDTQKLSAALGCEVVETSAIKGTGSKEVAEKAIAMANAKAVTVPQHSFSESVEKAITEIGKLSKDKIPSSQYSRWFAVKLFERDQKIAEQLQFSKIIQDQMEAVISVCEKEEDDDSESIITNERYNYIGKLVSKCVHRKHSGMTVSDKIDRIVTNRWLAIPIFAVIMTLVYYISVTTLGAMATDFVNDTLFGDWITSGVTNLLASIGAADWLSGLIVNGIIGGVGTVLGFVPQMLLLFFFLSILEDSGYMARVAFIMDRVFRKFGLSGKSFIPILIGSGCGVPAIMASRTIENEKDRKMTIMITTFIPCTAKTVIIAMVISTFFPNYPWIAPAMYLLGIAVIIASGVILKKTRLFSGDPAPFVMELPQYHIPGAKGVLIHMWERAKAFIIKAGTIIFIASGLVWFLSSFGWNLQMVDIENSMLAAIGRAFAWFFVPLGFGTWKATVATISALAAKENAISTLAVLNNVADTENSQAVMTGLASMFTSLGALSFMIFNLFCPPCFAAIGATRREMGSLKWTMIAFGYQVLAGYSLAFVVNQLGSVFLGGAFGIGAAIAVVFLAVLVFLLVRPASDHKAILKQAHAA
jgi:ferrous iron transport protein B